MHFNKISMFFYFNLGIVGCTQCPSCQRVESLTGVSVQNPAIPIPISHVVAPLPIRGYVTEQQPIRAVVADSKKTPGGGDNVSLGGGRISLRDRLLHGSQSPGRVRVNGGGGTNVEGGGGGGTVCSLSKVREGVVTTTSLDLRSSSVTTSTCAVVSNLCIT